MKTAIILGATGLTGGLILQELIQDPRYGKIKLFSRNKVAVKNKKIEEHLVDLLNLVQYKEHFRADEVYCCIGTTKSKTPDEETYKKIDYGIPVNAARIAREQGIKNYLVISALGADENSKMFYNRTKGEMERDVLAQNIENTYLFQPALIAGDREEQRVFENLAKKAMKVLNYVMVGPLKKYRSIHPLTIAKAMVIVANSKYHKTNIPSDEIKEIVADSPKD
jgi:uncharacterized protein YbjT (DUF2867 family)